MGWDCRPKPPSSARRDAHARADAALAVLAVLRDLVTPAAELEIEGLVAVHWAVPADPVEAGNQMDGLVAAVRPGSPLSILSPAAFDLEQRAAREHIVTDPANGRPRSGLVLVDLDHPLDIDLVRRHPVVLDPRRVASQVGLQVNPS